MRWAWAGDVFGKFKYRVPRLTQDETQRGDQINAFGTIAIASSTLEIFEPSRIAMISGAFPLAKRD